MPACDSHAVAGVAKGELSPECDNNVLCFSFQSLCDVRWLHAVHLGIDVCLPVSGHCKFCVCVCLFMTSVCVCLFMTSLCVCTMCVCHIVCHVFVCVCECAYTCMHMLVYVYQVTVVWVTVGMFTCQMTCVYVQIVIG